MQDLIVKTLPDKQKAVYATRHFEPEHIFAKFEGSVITSADFPPLSKGEVDNLLQIGEDYYLKQTDISKFIRHACNPNAGIHIIAKKAFLIAIIDIAPNDEITFDYSITSTDTPETWHMNCDCVSWNCRKNISGFNSLPDNTKDFAAHYDLIPSYISYSKNS